MKNEPIFNWDEETGAASCILSDGEKIYTGFAQCHPDDEDMKGQKTGCEIAFRRARINALRGYRDELKIKLSALNQLYYSMNISSRFNEKSYENKMLQRQIRMINFDLATTKEMIATEQENLSTYIKEKDEFYNKTRKRRAMREEKANNN
jgi:hypothetical protein